MPADDETRLFDGLDSLGTSSRRRSSLFDALPRTRSRNEYTNSTVDHEQSQPQSRSAIVLESQMLSNAASTRQASFEVQRKQPLFGTVMNHSEYLEPASDRIPRSPKTPVFNTGDVERSIAFDEIGSSVMSPTGKTVMGFVNNFGNSPFRFQSPKKRSRLQSKLADPDLFNQILRCTSKKQKRDSATQNDQYSKVGQDWLEIPVTGDKLSCLDFSLRTTVLFECNLNICLRSVMTQDSSRKHLAYWIYPHMSSDSLCASDSMSLEKNQRSAASRVHSSSKTSLSRTTKQETPVVPSYVGKRLINLVKGDKALFSSKHIGYIQRREDTSSSMYWWRWRWQEATRSMFLKWCDCIKALLDGNEKKMLVSDIYFYCLAKDHVAIFRVDEKIDLKHSKKQYEPRVILSNITSEFKMKLEHEGIEEIQYLLNEAAEIYSSRENSSTTPMSPNIKAELEALRRAQAFGENAGADVRVKSKVRKAKYTPANHAESPCSIFGFENVSCFFEVYLNSFGQMQTSQAQHQYLPFLVCDTIGPFLHASLETLKLRPMKTMGTESVRLEGLIMPSAFRSVVATITREVVRLGKSPQHQTNMLEDNEATVSYMLIETGTNEELSPVSRKLEDSRAFNVWNANKNNQSAESDMLECEKGRYIKRLVWEAKSPEVLACNFD